MGNRARLIAYEVFSGAVGTLAGLATYFFGGHDIVASAGTGTAVGTLVGAAGAYPAWNDQPAPAQGTQQTYVDQQDDRVLQRAYTQDGADRARAETGVAAAYIDSLKKGVPSSPADANAATTNATYVNNELVVQLATMPETAEYKTIREAHKIFIEQARANPANAKNLSTRQIIDLMRE